jgi:hypothetical protein
MGTSQSSKGPGAGVPLVPPWADEVDASDPLSSSDTAADDSDSSPTEDPPDPLAPGSRFRDARRSLGSFARTGNTHYLRRTLRHYVSSGYGGSGTMSRRFSGTARTAGRLNGLLQPGGGSGLTGDAIRDAVLRGGSDVGAVLDAIADAASPVNGTQDGEIARRSVRDSLTDLLEKYPDADLLGLSDAQRAFVIERFTTHEVYGRFLLDMQQSVIKAAGDPQTALSRLRQIREFIATQVSSAFRAIQHGGSQAVTADVTRLTAQALKATMTVFEEYIR